MTRKRKVAVSVGVLALLLGIGVNMQVSAMTPKAAKSSDTQKKVPNPKGEGKANFSKEDKTYLELKDTTIMAGEKWNPADNVVKAIDSNGDVVPVKDLLLEGANGKNTPGIVDNKFPGVYKAKFTIVDCCTGGRTSKIANITVTPKPADYTHITAKNSRINVGDKWKAEDNFVLAKDMDNKTIAFKDVTVKGSVDTKKGGMNEVTYTVLNRDKKEVSATATIEVVDDKTSLEVKDSTIWVGDTWQAEDNLVKATDKDGKDIDIKDIDVKGTVDTSKAAKYEVIYTVSDSQGTKIIRKATITVKEKGNDGVVGKDDKNDAIGGGGGNLPNTGYDVSSITVLLGLAGFLGAGSFYLTRRQHQE